MTPVQKCLAPCLMPKGRKYLYITAFFYCLKTLIPWFAITWPGFQVKKWCFFAEVFAEFVRKHIIISFLADSRLLSRFCVADYQAEGNAFVLAHLHGRRDVSYKPAIQQTSHLLRSFSGTCRVRQGLPPLLRPNTRCWFVCLTSPYTFKPHVSCGFVVLQYDI